MRTDGSDWQPVLTSSRQDHAASWSHDGQRILFTADAGYGLDIYSLDLRRKELKRLTTNAPGHGVPYWSSDETVILFTRYQGEQSDMSDIYVMHADGSDQKKAPF